jgi:hypothetical protein
MNAHHTTTFLKGHLAQRVKANVNERTAMLQSNASTLSPSINGLAEEVPEWLLPGSERRSGSSPGIMCPRCEGVLYRDEYGDRGCYICGWQGYRRYQGPEITGKGLRLPGS